MMVYNTKNHWVCVLCSLSGTLNKIKHNILDTGSVSVLGEGRETPTLFDSSIIESALSKEPNRVGVSCPSPGDGNRSSFRNVVFSTYLEFWLTDKVHKPNYSEIQSCYMHDTTGNHSRV
jgi:hypothetical protein